MKKLNYDVLNEIGYNGYILKNAPEKVLQFGEGNFMRAFVDYFIDEMNEKSGFNGKVVLVQPIRNAEGSFRLNDIINEQEGLYTLYLRGFADGCKVNKKRVISSVSRCLNAYEDYEEVMKCAENPELRFIACNTTEAGIQYDPSNNFEDRPAETYPGKLTQFLYKRYELFGNEHGKGFIILSCELIDNNGKELEKCVKQYAEQWKLPEEFINWIDRENVFCSTLVDRIVTGYPRAEAEQLNEANGYIDNAIDTGEIFGFYVIEGPEYIKKELPFEDAGLPIIVTDNHKPYKQRKVRILNGAHTSFVLGAYLSGQDIVRNCMDDKVINSFMNKTIYDEIIPTLTLPKEELCDFAASVTERFKNPFIDHQLLSISLNSTSKWRARVMPSMLRYIELKHEIPECIAASLAFYIQFYCGEELTDKGLTAHRPDGTAYIISDDRNVLEFYNTHKNDDPHQLVKAVLSNSDFFGEDLSKIDGLCDKVTEDLIYIRNNGAYELMKKCI